MSYYLQMNGTSDFIQLPSMTLNKIVFYGKVRRNSTTAKLVWDFRTGIGFTYLLQDTTGLDSVGSGSAKVNNVSVTNNTAFVPNNTLCTIEHTFSAGTDNGNIFSNNAGSATSCVSGDIYDVKIYNGASLVAWYDMTLGNQVAGTVQDQSGNGRHATLTGGTWVSDATGTDVSISSVVATATNNGVTPNVSAQVSKTIVSVAAAASSQAISPSFSSSSNTSITGTVATVALSGISPSVSTGVNITSTLTNALASANTPFIGSLNVTVNVVVASASSQFVPPNVTIAYEVISVVNLEFETLKTVQLEASINRVVNVEALLTRIVALEGEL